MTSRKDHWEKVYSASTADEFSWTQKVPKTSLNFLHGFKLPKTASIIDIGGGDSRFADYLLEEGYEDITVLDISEGAIDRAKQRLGKKSSLIKWVVSDITMFRPTGNYDCWHDRATFHFLTSHDDIESYLGTALSVVNRYMIIGTFSDKGPRKCSMLDVHQYSEKELQKLLSIGFRKIKCVTEDHITPFNTTQNFLFCSFRRATHRS